MGIKGLKKFLKPLIKNGNLKDKKFINSDNFDNKKCTFVIDIFNWLYKGVY